MTSDFSNGHNPHDGGMPITKLPEQVDGFIDLDILVDIHKSLSESEKSDDIALAAWVKQNYLQEPLAETGRPIRDVKGFVNLDKAYRRVRQLTGKAQDKWPFFDKNWKKMPSTVVKNAILGDAAIGMIRSETDGQIHDTLTNNGFDGQLDYASQTPKLQMSSSTNNPNGHRMGEQKSPQPVDHSLANLHETEQKAHRQAPDRAPTSKASSVSGAAARNENVGSPAFDSTINSSTPPVDGLRDAGAGKVRGPHGRYVNKNKPPPPAAKKGLNVKYVKKSRTRAALESESEEDDVSSDEGVKVPKTLLDIASITSDSDGEVIQSSSEPSANAQNADAALHDFPVSAILAAEAEAVPSNLDRLPPGFTHKKRKSESSIQRGSLKRARGSRGGLLGRPRKSETLTKHSQPEAGESVEVDQAPSQPETPAKTPTRRSSRKSAASALESSTPWDPAADVLLNGAGQKQPANNNNNNNTATVNDAHAASQGDHRNAGTLTGVDQETRSTIKKTVDGASFTAPGKPSSSQPLKAQKAPTSVNQKKRVSFSPEIQAGTVEFFARISTGAGTQEVSLSEEDLTSEVDLVKRYAAWQNAGNANVSFEVFKNIVKFAG